jgi:hypothetical protein
MQCTIVMQSQLVLKHWNYRPFCLYTYTRKNAICTTIYYLFSSCIFQVRREPFFSCQQKVFEELKIVTFYCHIVTGLQRVQIS